VLFLLDENVPFELLDALLARGHEATHVARMDAQAIDNDVLARAVRERACLVTFDSDFGRLIFYERHEPPPAIIYIQSRPDGAPETIRALLEVLDAGNLKLEGQFVVIDQQAGLRVLPLS
jgi:predicted nuclease of predicted toxin-antitoxin system